MNYNVKYFYVTELTDEAVINAIKSEYTYDQLVILVLSDAIIIVKILSDTGNLNLYMMFSTIEEDIVHMSFIALNEGALGLYVYDVDYGDGGGE